MSKFKEIISEKTTWAIGIPSIVYGGLILADADEAKEVSDAVASAGQVYVENGGDWQTALGWLAAGLLGIFMKGRR